MMSPFTATLIDLRHLRFDGCFRDDARIGDHDASIPVVFPETVFAVSATNTTVMDAKTPPTADPDATIDTPYDASQPDTPPPTTVPFDRSRLPSLGDVLDKYRIDAELGTGGFAVVYRATHLLMKTPVAIKLLYPWTLDRHPQLAEQLCEEARFTSLIDHPNVVRIHDVTASDRFTFIVMEYIDGINLGQMFAKRPLDPLTTVKVGMHVCAGLKAGLTQGLVHRDIKPANILIARTGQAKIVDFGLARQATEGLMKPDASRPRDPFRTCGTPAYIAPEQVLDFDRADFRADIYSLGATLFHAVLGRPPFPERDPWEAIHGHLHVEPPAPRSLRPDLPESLEALLLRMLAKQPAQRHASYDELYADLRRIYHDLRSKLPATDTPLPTKERTTRTLVRKLKTMFTDAD